MKTNLYKIFILILILNIQFSCKNDDNENKNEVPQPINSIYFPMNLSNTWNYEGIGTGAINSTSKFNGTVSVGGKTYQKYLQPQNLFGFIGESINIRKENSSYFMNGDFLINDTPINVDDVLFFNETTEVGKTINTYKFVYNAPDQSFNESGLSGKFQSKIIYTFIAVVEQKGKFTVNGKEYNDIIKVGNQIKVEADIKIIPDLTLIPPINHKLVELTDIGKLTQNFAKDLGTVQTNIKIDGSKIKFNNTISTLTGLMDISEYTKPYEEDLKKINENRTYNLTSQEIKN